MADPGQVAGFPAVEQPYSFTTTQASSTVYWLPLSCSIQQLLHIQPLPTCWLASTICFRPAHHLTSHIESGLYQLPREEHDYKNKYYIFLNIHMLLQEGKIVWVKYKIDQVFIKEFINNKQSCIHIKDNHWIMSLKCDAYSQRWVHVMLERNV